MIRRPRWPWTGGSPPDHRRSTRARRVPLGRGKLGLNKKILDLTSTDGAAHRLMVDDYDAFTAQLREQIARRARLVDAGAEQWQVQAA